MDHDAELDAILEQVETAGLVEQYVDEQGRPAMRLTAEGLRVARQLVMLGEDGQDALMAALLEASKMALVREGLGTVQRWRGSDRAYRYGAARAKSAARRASEPRPGDDSRLVSSTTVMWSSG